MNITGIIVEYNPFHNGHIYHINEAKRITNPDLLICITSGNYVQRGEPSIINKFEKTKAALKYGVDLVIELPYIHTIQNATIFGQKAIQLLNELKINNLVFGSETNNLEELKKIASFNINIDHLKEEMNKGFSYPKAYGLLTSFLYPNDLLALSYLKALKDMDIKPISIQRTNDYNGLELKEIASAKALREAIKNNQDINNYSPIDINDPIFIEDFYPYLRKILITRNKNDLHDIFLVNEGIENLLIKNAYKYDKYDDFINNSISKRYTKTRINRTCMNIINDIKKIDVKNLKNDNYIRVLGFNSKGQEYLKKLRKENINIVTQFKNIPKEYKDVEWKVNNLYYSYTKDYQASIKQELKGPIIID